MREASPSTSQEKENCCIMDESQRQSALSTKSIKRLLFAGSLEKSKLGIEAQRYSHLLESTLVIMTIVVGRKERMCRKTSSGKFHKHLLFSSMYYSSFGFGFFWSFFISQYKWVYDYHGIIKYEMDSWIVHATCDEIDHIQRKKMWKACFFLT